MANPDDLATILQGVSEWNAARERDPDGSADLSGAMLRGLQLEKANFNNVDLRRANLRGAQIPASSFFQADLREADLTNANLTGSDLRRADIRSAKLFKANLASADLRESYTEHAIFHGADLSRAQLGGSHGRHSDFSNATFRDADLTDADLRHANLSEANLEGAHLVRTKCGFANLYGAELSKSFLIATDFSGADLSGTQVFGAAIWDLTINSETRQHDIIVTPKFAGNVTVDNIELAQFIHLMMRNEKLKTIIEGVTSKLVLILGRFSHERKPILEVIRQELRARNYLPILFDFEKPDSRTTDETITLLSRMARFIVADLTDARSVLQELRGIVPEIPSVPVQTIIQHDQAEPGMLDFYSRSPSFLKPFRYEDAHQIILEFDQMVVMPAEAKLREFRET